MTIEKEEHQSADPQFEDTPVYNVPRGYDLDKLDQSILNLIDPKTLSFYHNPEEYFSEFSNSVTSEVIKKFIKLLSKLDFRLIIIPRGKYNRSDLGTEKGGAYISFNDSDKKSSNWIVDFEFRMYDPSIYPKALLDLLRFGTIKFSYYLDGAQMWQLGNENWAMKNESFNLELQYLDEEGDDLNFPYEELRIMYEDYCGSYIFYDNKQEVWYGGMEEGGFFKVELSLSEVIDSIFLTHMKEEYPSIDTIIEGKYLTNSNTR